MKTVEIKLYKFDELSELAQEKAIKNLYDINVDYDWWDCIYDDAAQVGFKINGFDIDRASYVKGSFINSASDCANRIIKEHGPTCDTYKTAKAFLDERLPLIEKEDNEDDFDVDLQVTIVDLENQFLKDLCEDYRIILTHEYEYLTSKEAIIETIEANDYDFTEDGTLY